MATAKATPSAAISVKLNHEKLSKDKTKVLSVKDYVLIDNLWVDPAKALAIAKRIASDGKKFIEELESAASACSHAKMTRDTAPKVKVVPHAIVTQPAIDPALLQNPQAVAALQMLMQMLGGNMTQPATPPQPPTVATPPDADGKRETAKERAERLRSVTK
jgi:hypothetical protein